MSNTAAVVCMTSSTRTMERVFVASARSEASQGVLIGRKAAGEKGGDSPRVAPVRGRCERMHNLL